MSKKYNRKFRKMYQRIDKGEDTSNVVEDYIPFFIKAKYAIITARAIYI